MKKLNHSKVIEFYLASEDSQLKVARKLGINKGTLWRILKNNKVKSRPQVKFGKIHLHPLTNNKW